MRRGAVEAVRPERAVRAALIPVGREHEVVHDQLAAPVEQLGKASCPVRALEEVLLGDLFPGQVTSLPGEFLAQPGELLLPLQQRLAGDHPFFRGHHCVLIHRTTS